MYWRQGKDCNVLVEPVLVSLENKCSLLAACTLHYLPIVHWPTHRRLCKEAWDVLHAAWAFARNRPMTGVSAPKNDRCMTCGWLTGRRVCEDDEHCAECHNSCVCVLCTYQVGGQLRCLECDILPDHCTQSQLHFVKFMDHVLDRVDSLQLCGKYHAENRAASTLMMMLGSWKQFAKRIVLARRLVIDPSTAECLSMAM